MIPVFLLPENAKKTEPRKTQNVSLLWDPRVAKNHILPQEEKEYGRKQKGDVERERERKKKKRERERDRK